MEDLLMPNRTLVPNRMTVLVTALFLSSVAWSQTQPAQSGAQSGSSNMPGMNMPDHDMSNMKDMPGMDMGKDADSEASAHAMHSMEGHMDMGPHMKMTALRPPKPGDAERAQQVVEAARRASE